MRILSLLILTLATLVAANPSLRSCLAADDPFLPGDKTRLRTFSLRLLSSPALFCGRYLAAIKEASANAGVKTHSLCRIIPQSDRLGVQKIVQTAVDTQFEHATLTGEGNEFADDRRVIVSAVNEALQGQLVVEVRECRFVVGV